MCLRALCCCWISGCALTLPTGPLEPADSGSTLIDAGESDAGVQVPDAGTNPVCDFIASGLQRDVASVATGAYGTGVAVLIPGCERMYEARGYSVPRIDDAYPGRPLDIHALFRIGSVTKTFIAAGVLRAQEQGLLSLDDRLSTWFPNFPGSANITIRQLLSHTSGVFNYTRDESFRTDFSMAPGRKRTPEQLIAFAASHPLDFTPGTQWSYSNTNYILSGVILERVTGQPLAAWIRTQFLQPLEMVNTFFDGEETVPPLMPFTHGYYRTDADVTYATDPSWAWAAGAMVSNTDDLLTWGEALYGGKVLSPASMMQMMTVTPTALSGLSYGLGMFDLDAKPGFPHAVGHMGDTLGYHTQLFFTPHPQTVVVLFTNSDELDVNATAASTLPAVYSRGEP